MAQQVKVPDDVKHEIEVFAGITGRTQGELVAASWREYRERHGDEFRASLRRAEAILDDAKAASVYASGMSSADLAELAAAARGE